MIFNCEQVEEGGLKRKLWGLRFPRHSDITHVEVVTYREQSRRSKRHKWTLDRAWTSNPNLIDMRVLGAEQHAPRPELTKEQGRALQECIRALIPVPVVAPDDSRRRL